MEHEYATSVIMLSTKNPNSASDMKKQNRPCALRTVGRAGSCRHSKVLHCSGVVPVSRSATIRKPAAHRIRPVSTVQKDTQFDSLMIALSSDHTYWAKPNHRRSSLPMDYRWLAGMKPKWYANAKRRRSVSNQQETTKDTKKQLEMSKLDDEVTIQKSADMSPSEVHYDEVSDRYNKTESVSVLLTSCRSDTRRADSVQSCQYPIEKLVWSEPPFDQSSERHNVVRSYVLDSDMSHHTVILQGPLVPVLMTACGETVASICEDRQIKTVKQLADEPIACSVRRRCDVDRPERESEDGAPVLSDTHDTMFKAAACCSSDSDCFHFCDSNLLSTECETDTSQNKQELDAGYISCDGSHKVMVDLNMVGIVETVSENIESAICVGDGHSASAADVDEHEDFVDNICVDCGCELTSDDMARCAYSVPICTICSHDASHNVLSVDSIAAADHSYARLPTEHLECPSPLKETLLISPSVKFQQSEMPDVDSVDDVTFLSFSSKLSMHKYISRQQNVCDPAVKSSWTELARCERSWYGSHKSHRRAWLGSVRHRHIDRFSAHNRLNQQIELGLVKPISTQNSADLLGIRLKTCLSQSQNNADKTVVAKKFKCRTKPAPNDLQVQRPIRIAARGQHYCLTRFRRKGNTPITFTDGECVVMKLSRQQVDEALTLLHVPSVITRNSCSQPGTFSVYFICISML